ncbi:MAG: metalloprotease, partial [Halobacteria archaeon]|nr:metalloprotease [Halobacteria archaeon]
MVLELVLLGFLLYWTLVLILDNRGILERYNIKTAGPLLMLKTLRGRKLLDRLARPKKFWRIYGNLGVAVALFVMAISFVFIVFIGYVSLTSPPQPSQVTEPQNLLVIPGLNDF